jgi:hypothetical protein
VARRALLLQSVVLVLQAVLAVALQTEMPQLEAILAVLAAVPLAVLVELAVQVLLEQALVVQPRAAQVAQAEYRQQSAVLLETDRTVVHSVLLQLIPVLQVPLQAEQPQAELAAEAAQVQRLAVWQRAAQAEPAETLMAAQERQVAHQEAAALLTVVQVLQEEIAVS